MSEELALRDGAAPSEAQPGDHIEHNLTCDHDPDGEQRQLFAQGADDDGKIKNLDLNVICAAQLHVGHGDHERERHKLPGDGDIAQPEQPAQVGRVRGKAIDGGER